MEGVTHNNCGNSQKEAERKEEVEWGVQSHQIMMETSAFSLVYPLYMLKGLMTGRRPLELLCRKDQPRPRTRNW